MKIQVRTYTLPQYWASYLVNGDASGLDAGEKAKADKWLAATAAEFLSFGIVSTVDDSEQDFAPAWRFDCATLAGAAVDYVAHVEPYTLANVRRRFAYLGLTIRKTPAGEYLVRVKGSPAGEGYFANDLPDAFATGRRMAETRNA